MTAIPPQGRPLLDKRTSLDTGSEEVGVDLLVPVTPERCSWLIQLGVATP